MSTGRLVLCILIIMCFLIMIYAGGMIWFIVKPKRWSLQEYKERLQKKNIPFDDYYKCDRIALTIFSDYGYKLHGFLMMHREPTDKFVIVSHGYTANRWEGLPYANIYYELGYNVYLYDLRHHGENEDSFCSMGYYEHMDIIAIAEELRRLYGEQIQIGLQGVSLGASSSILALRLWEGFSFCVADCGFADFRQLMRHLAVKWFRLPAFMSAPVCWFSSLYLRFNIGRIKPLEALEENQVTPVMIIHGTADDFIPPIHARELYDAAKGYKELHYIEGVGHAESVIKEPEQYKQLVESFLENALAS